MQKSKPFIYSVPVTDKKQGETPILRHPDCKSALLFPPQQRKTLQLRWRSSVQNNFNRPCLQDYTYEQVDKMSKSLGSWLYKRGFKFLYIYSKNRWEWTVCDISCFRYGIVSVPLYDTLGLVAVNHILKVVEGEVIALNKQTINTFLKLDFTYLQKFKAIIIFQDLTHDQLQILKNYKCQIVNFHELINSETYENEPNILPNAHLTYSFTSGTTGVPKGVILTHWNFCSLLECADNLIVPINTDIHLSYLPLAHILERGFLLNILVHGAQVRYIKLPINQIIKQFDRVKPTFLVIAPKLLSRFYAVLSKFNHVSKELAQQAFKIKKANWQNNIFTSPYDDTVFKVAKNLFGGRLRQIIVGSAPAAPQLMNFYKVVLGIEVRQLYGQTQTLGGFICQKGDKSIGHVGGPMKALQFKIIDVPEMQYKTDCQIPRGQLCLRGNTVYQGYYKDEINTKQSIDKQGWQHTGDIVELLKNGAIRVIDRKKNIYKLSQGEYIAPQRIENVYLHSALVSQIFVYGQSLQSYNIGVTVPQKQIINQIAKKEGIQGNYHELIKNKVIIQDLLQKLNEFARKEGLLGFELIQKVILISEPFMNLGILTNTMKIKRNDAKKAFYDQIRHLYQEGK